ncbi:MAG: hypothetical protein KDK96_02700 [Chlamydiia bacterium]|nr:hypothetical protein [Chlamydiia bacterium]
MSVRMDTIFNAVSAYSRSHNEKDLKKVDTNADDIQRMFASDRSDGTNFFKGKGFDELKTFKYGLVQLKLDHPEAEAQINAVIEKVDDAARAVLQKDAKKEKKPLKREGGVSSANPHETHRVQTQRPSTSSIPSKPSEKTSVREGKKPIRKETAPPPKTTTPAKSEPKTRQEEIRECIRLGTEAIDRTRFSSPAEKREAQQAMETMAKMLPYDKHAESGSFQNWLNYAYPTK